MLAEEVAAALSLVCPLVSASRVDSFLHLAAVFGRRCWGASRKGFSAQREGVCMCSAKVSVCEGIACQFHALLSFHFLCVVFLCFAFVFYDSSHRGSRSFYCRGHLLLTLMFSLTRTHAQRREDFSDEPIRKQAIQQPIQGDHRS